MPPIPDTFTPPSARLVHWATALHKAYFDPVFLGLQQIDLERPALWVGNHTLYAMLDTPLLCERLYQEGVMLRALGDRGHLKVPLWGQALLKAGMVPGSPENCQALMLSGQHILVFPGGGREVMRRKGEAYQLIWKQRTGFARMAIEHGYDIIPFAALGPDEALDIVADANDIMASRAWRWLKNKLPLDRMTRGGDMIPPLVKGLGFTPLPRPERIYFGFGARIATQHLAGNTDQATLWALRETVAECVRDQLCALKKYRATDRPVYWSRLRRWLSTSTDELDHVG